MKNIQDLYLYFGIKNKLLRERCSQVFIGPTMRRQGNLYTLGEFFTICPMKYSDCSRPTEKLETGAVALCTVF